MRVFGARDIFVSQMRYAFAMLMCDMIQILLTPRRAYRAEGISRLSRAYRRFRQEFISLRDSRTTVSVNFGDQLFSEFFLAVVIEAMSFLRIVPHLSDTV